MADLKVDDIELMNEDKEEDYQIEKQLRKGFIRKVYGTIFFQLLITTVVVYYVMINESIQKFMQENVNLCLIPFFLSIGIMLLLVCTKLAQKVPINYILLITFLSLDLVITIIIILHESNVFNKEEINMGILYKG